MLSTERLAPTSRVLGASLALASAIALLLPGCGSEAASNPGFDAGPLPDAGIDAPSPDAASSCASLLEEWGALLGSAKACTSASGCRWTAQALPAESPFCRRQSVRSDADDAALVELATRFSAMGCEVPSACGADAPAATPICIDGACSAADACSRCSFDDLAPVCTDRGANAQNACVARDCLGARSWTDGFCPDTAACTARAGTCEERVARDPTVPLCPEGRRVEGNFAGGPCSSGTLFSHCCVPWDQPCTHLPFGLSLLSDPFECGAQPRRVCIEPPRTLSACTSTAWEWRESFGGSVDPNVELTVVSGTAGRIEVDGRHRTTGRTFRCRGTVGWDVDRPVVWQCESCAGASCRSCDVQQALLCPA
jgi:hypothetical protein